MKTVAEGEKTSKTPPETSESDGFCAVRERILAALIDRAAFDGWTEAALQGAAAEAGASRAEAAAAYPRGAGDALKAWSMALDKAMLAAMATDAFAGLKIREKVAFAVRARLAAMRPHKEAARRAAATLALPQYAPLGAQLAWASADAVWRGLGDKSTDFNYYSKRSILTGLWTSVFARWLADDSDGEVATSAFLDARIENVMQIEKLKAKVRALNIDPKKPIEWLARLRYPAPGAKARTGENTAAREAKIDEALEETFPASDAPYWTP